MELSRFVMFGNFHVSLWGLTRYFDNLPVGPILSSTLHTSLHTNTVQPHTFTTYGEL